MNCNIIIFWLLYRYRLILQYLQPEPISFVIPNNYIFHSIKYPSYNSSNDASNASAAFIPNFPSSDASALSFDLTHSFKPFTSLGGGSPPPEIAPPPPGNNASTSTQMAIPIAVSIEAIVIPCSLNRVLIFSSNELSLSNTLAIASLKLVI